MLIVHIQKKFIELQKGLAILGDSKKVANLNKDTILLVGMVESSHFQRWLSITQQELPNRKILVFASDRPRFSRSKFRTLKQQHKDSHFFNLIPHGKANFASYYLLDSVFGLRWRAYFLARLIKSHKPAIIHFHETQHAAYLYNLIFSHRSIPNNSKKIISTWGSDLSLYSWVEEHQPQIRCALGWTDVLTTEKMSEREDAERLGFKGDFLSPVYISLGRSESEFKSVSKPSSRNIVMVKGYQDNPGRALNALYAVSQLEKELNGYEVLVYSASESTRIQVEVLRNRNSINIRCLNKISHAEMQEIFCKSRISIGLAISDGLPGALLEAMQAGAFPIQSENSGVGEFIVHGENGFIVNPWDLDSITENLKHALINDHLVDAAVDINRRVLINKYSLSVGIAKLHSLYDI